MTSPRPSRLRVPRSLIAASVLTVALVAWLLTGETSSQPPSPALDPAAAELGQSLRVTTERIDAAPLDDEVVVRGQLEPLRWVVLRAETDGRVNRVPARKGDFLNKGDTIAELSLNAREARRAEAAALVEQRRVSQLAAQGLFDQGVQSRSIVILRNAELAAAEASLARIMIEMQQTIVRAPFAGILNDRQVEVGDFVDRGDQIGVIVDTKSILLTGQVPQQQIGSLAVGQTAKGRLITGDLVEGAIRYISVVAELDTRSFRVEIEVSNPDQKLIPGSSVDLLLKTTKNDGHCFPAALLTITADGATAVKVVGANRIVALEKVEVVHATPTDVCVTGLPASTEIITSGQGLVLAGQRLLDDGTVTDPKPTPVVKLGH